MNQQEFTRIIESGQNISITPGLMAAARARGHFERSEAIRATLRWMVQRAQSALHHLTGATEAVSTGNTPNACGCTH